MTPITEQQALSRLATLCAKGEHCTGEMTDKMVRWGIASDARQRIIDYLTENRYIDDHRYCERFINDKMQFNKWGPRKIEQALWAKHMNEDISREALCAITDEEWTQLLMPLLKAKSRSIKAESDYEATMKLKNFALSRGFTHSHIAAALKEMAQQ